jgi:hypothetical protein
MDQTFPRVAGDLVPCGACYRRGYVYDKEGLAYVCTACKGTGTVVLREWKPR